MADRDKSPMMGAPEPPFEAKTGEGGTELVLRANNPVESLRLLFSEYLPSLSVEQSRVWLLAIVILSGINFGLVKEVGETMDGVSILAIRFAIAAASLTPWLVRARKEAVVAGLETGAWLAAGYAVQSACLQSGTNAGVAAFFASLSSIVCPFLERFTGKKLPTRAWVAAALAAAGAGVLELGGGEMPTSGDLVGLLQPLMFGIYLFRTENAMSKYANEAMEITSVQVAVCAAAGAAWWLATGDHYLFDPALADAGAGAIAASLALPAALLVLVSVFGTALALGAETVLVGKLSSSEVALMFACEPLAAAATGSVVMGETFGMNGFVGGGLAILACLTRTGVFSQESLRGMLNSAVRSTEEGDKEVKEKIP